MSEVKTEEVVVNITTGPDADGIVLLAKKVTALLKKMNINKDVKKLSMDKIIKINSEIQKLVGEVKILASEIKNIAPTEKAKRLMAITIKVLEHEDVQKLLSDEVKSDLREFTDNEEMVNVIMEILDWTSDQVLDGYDNDDNGAVTLGEVEADTVKCCACKGCCPCWSGFAKGFAKCWSKFFIKVLCCQCGSNQVVYDSDKYESSKK